MVIHMLPDTIFGQDTDDLLAYTTPKVAFVRDRHIGCLYYLLTLLAISWVIIGQVLWRNEHFLLKDVKGIPRMFFSHPTANQCDANSADCVSDYKPLSDLPYCLEHSGGPEVPHPAKCRYADKHSMFVDGTVGSQVFIPTSQVVMEEEKHCMPAPNNQFSCQSEYKQSSFGTEGQGKGYYFNETNMEFFANIEDFTVQFTSTYHREAISGTSLDHPGFYLECHDEKPDQDETLTWEERLHLRKDTCEDERKMPVECMPGMACHKGGLKTIEDVKIKGVDGIEMQKKWKEAQKKSVNTLDKAASGKLDDYEPGDDSFVQMPGVSTSRKSLRASYARAALVAESAQQPGSLKLKPEKQVKRATPDVFASSWGDTFKVGKLIELADLDLDRHLNMDGMSARMAGSILEVEATYSNLHRFLSSFGMSQVQYVYRVKERKLPYVSRETLHPDQPADYPKHRRYIVQHGILLDFKVGGEFGFIRIVYLLIMLTTSLALLATAHKLTDLTSLYIHPRRNNYFHLKYECSPDFSDMWRCHTCSFYNMPSHETCKGLEKWMCASETPVCGAARPDAKDLSARRESVTM